jgi:hypothetical protein
MSPTKSEDRSASKADDFRSKESIMIKVSIITTEVPFNDNCLAKFVLRFTNFSNVMDIHQTKHFMILFRYNEL